MRNRKLPFKKSILFVVIFSLVSAVFGQALKGTKVDVRVQSGPDKLNPYTNLSATGSMMMEYLYFSLLRTDKESFEYVPILANDLPNMSGDELTFTYMLDENAKWNSKDDVTAQDVVFSMKMIKNPHVKNDDKRIHYSNIANVVAESDRKVVFTLKKASPQSLRVTGEFAVLPVSFFDPDGKISSITFEKLENPSMLTEEEDNALQEVAARINAFGTSMDNYSDDVACGPYTLTEWVKGKSIVLTANKKFWGKKYKDYKKTRFFKQNIETINFRIIPDDQVARGMVFKGQLDLVLSMPPDLFFELSELPDIVSKYEFMTPEGPSWDYIGLNMRGSEVGRNPALEDVEVRRALAFLVNKDYLLKQKLYGYGKLISSDCPSPNPDFRNPSLKPIVYNALKAGEILDKAGWKDSDGDGVREKLVNGEKVELNFELVLNENSTIRKVIAESFINTAKPFGIKIRTTQLPFAEYLKKLKAKEFDLMLGAWVSDPNEDSYSQIWHSRNWNKGSNWVGFGNPATDKLIELYDTETNADNRKTISHSLQQQIFDTHPYIFLWSNTEKLIISKRFSRTKTYTVRPGFWLGEWEPN